MTLRNPGTFPTLEHSWRYPTDPSADLLQNVL